MVEQGSSNQDDEAIDSCDASGEYSSAESESNDSNPVSPKKVATLKSKKRVNLIKSTLNLVKNSPSHGRGRIKSKRIRRKSGSCCPSDEDLFSDQAIWDNYQENYLSEAYSETQDIELARQLLEFGDDYRQFLDSQSDLDINLDNHRVCIFRKFH